MFHGVPVYSVFVMIRETKSPSTPVKEAEGKVYELLDPLDPTYSQCVQFELISAFFTVSGLMFFYFKRILGAELEYSIFWASQQLLHVLRSCPCLFPLQHCADTGRCLCVLVAS